MAGKGIDPALAAAVRHLATTQTLLVACDYDGTVAPIVADPDQAVPLPAAVTALHRLAALPRTHAALVSGRARADLARLAGTDGQVHLIGSHGTEFDTGIALPGDAVARRRRLVATLRTLVDGNDGVRLEEKPVSVAVHVRNAPRPVAERVLSAVAAGPATWDGVESTEGKEVWELAVIPTSKGAGLDRLRNHLGATAVLFAGDDVTDEKAFAALRDGDVGVKVGPGPSAAAYRVPDPTAVARLLTTLADERGRVVGG